MSMSLTERQAATLRFIAGYQLAHDGVSPSMRDIAGGLGLHGAVGWKSGVSWLLNKLEERGAIRRMRFHVRAIEVLVPVTVPRAPDGAALFAVPMPEAANGELV
jgi:SOS-response transcriptional repressor LexA